jgi:6-phosphofructokinase 1
VAIGILTSGGDCPGLNAVIRAAVLKGTSIYGKEFIGFRDGWRGVVEGDAIPLVRKDIQGIGKLGGTILGTSRTNPFDGDPTASQALASIERLGVEALIVIGGEGTLSAGKELADLGVPVVGVPKTIDNDLSATDMTFGFDTAVGIATDAFDRLRTTGDSHGRAMVAEVMGRHVGWIALHSGMAAGAHAILIPEQRTSWDRLADWVMSARERGRSPLVVVSEGFVPEGGTEAYSDQGLDTFGRPRLGGIGELVTAEIEARTGMESRCTILGHIQRGGTPTAYDRVLATRFGLAAIDAVVHGRFGRMVSLRGTDITHVALEDAIGKINSVPQSRWDEAAILFG